MKEKGGVIKSNQKIFGYNKTGINKGDESPIDIKSEDFGYQ
jgi:hypothetical protein